MKMRGPPGFSLVEVAVFAAVSLVPLAVVWSMLVTGSRQGGKVSARLSALQAAELLSERLRDDVAQGCRFPSNGTLLEGQQPTAEPGHELTLLRFRSYLYDAQPGALYSPAAKGGWVCAEPVEYRFDPATGRLLRNGRDVAAGSFANVRFRIVKGAAAGAAQDDCGNRLELTVSLAAAPGEAGKVLHFVFGLPRLTATEIYAGWEQNCFDREPRVET